MKNARDITSDPSGSDAKSRRVGHCHACKRNNTSLHSTASLHKEFGVIGTGHPTLVCAECWRRRRDELLKIRRGAVKEDT